MRYALENAVQAAVDFLVPRGSCSSTRWLTFHLEARDTKTGADFAWMAQYNAASNYVAWRTVLEGGVPHILFGDVRDSGTPWVPVDSVPEYVRKLYSDRDVAPGLVIAHGCHDSCWRDHATMLDGYPRDAQGRMTRHAVLDRDAVVHVRRMQIEGAPREGLPRVLRDGEWVNDTSLTGPWAVFQGMSRMASCVDQPGLALCLDGRFSCPGKQGKVRRRSARIHYQIVNGLVTNGWRPVEAPYVLDATSFWRDAGFSEKQISEGRWRLDHLYAEAPHGGSGIF